MRPWNPFVTSGALLRPRRTYASSRALHDFAAKQRFKILFMGRDEFSCLVLRELYSAEDVWEDISIATHPDEHVGRRGSQLSISPLKLLGESLKIPVHTIPRKKPEFRHWQPPQPFYPSPSDPPPVNHLLVTASFGRILPLKMLNLFRPGKRLNVHPSKLPSYRGPAPIQHTILNGESQTGVCVIEMLKKSEGIDSGSMWGCSRMLVPENATFEPLRDILAKEGGQLLVSALRDMQAGQAISLQQLSAEDAPIAPMITTVDSIVNFNTMSAEAIVRRHRAISHQRPLTTHLPTYKSKTLQLHEPKVLPLSLSDSISLSTNPGAATFHKPTKALLIRCADGSVLSVPRVKQEGKALVNAADWWNGMKGLQLVVDREVKLGLGAGTNGSS